MLQTTRTSLGSSICATRSFKQEISKSLRETVHIPGIKAWLGCSQRSVIC